MSGEMTRDHIGDANEMVLRRCPFCGGEAKVVPFISMNESLVECSECETKTAMFHGIGKKCIAAWNRRTPEPSKESNVDWDAVMSAHQVKGECEYDPDLLLMECPHYGCDFAGNWQCYRPDGRECPKEEAK